MQRVAGKANVVPTVHILRHTFCSHLAMRGAPAKAIQELAGHQDLATTLLDGHATAVAGGNSVAMGSTEIVKSSR